MPARDVRRRKHRKTPIGDMRTKLCFQDPSLVPIAGAGQVANLEPLFSVYAQEETTNFGRHGHSKVNLKDAVSHRFVIRWRPDVDAEMIIERASIHGDIRLKILEIENLEGRNEYLRLFCKELGSSDKEATKAGFHGDGGAAGARA